MLRGSACLVLGEIRAGWINNICLLDTILTILPIELGFTAIGIEYFMTKTDQV